MDFVYDSGSLRERHDYKQPMQCDSSARTIMLSKAPDYSVYLVTGRDLLPTDAV